MCIRDSSHTVENIIKAIRAMFPKANEHRTVLRQLASYLVPVSYTHLRAHETVLDLVCRLLLEKKKQLVSNMNTHTIQT